MIKMISQTETIIYGLIQNQKLKSEQLPIVF